MATVEVGAIRWAAVAAPEADYSETTSRHGPPPTSSRENDMTAVTVVPGEAEIVPVIPVG